jgi:hypothetical protein
MGRKGRWKDHPHTKPKIKMQQMPITIVITFCCSVSESQAGGVEGVVMVAGKK